MRPTLIVYQIGRGGQAQVMKRLGRIGKREVPNSINKVIGTLMQTGLMNRRFPISTKTLMNHLRQKGLPIRHQKNSKILKILLNSKRQQKKSGLRENPLLPAQITTGIAPFRKSLSIYKFWIKLSVCPKQAKLLTKHGGTELQVIKPLAI